MKTQSYEIGMVGLGVMGRNLLLNMADHGHSVAGYDKDATKVAALRQEAKNRDIHGAENLAEFVGLLRVPRAVMMLVPAGAPIDAVIRDLLPCMARGDLIIDGGNSHFTDTDLRAKTLAKREIQFLGVGVSGGEHGARHGPSIMPGGPREAYARVQPVFEAIAAQVEGEPCVTWLGPRSAGHYVKMVHNGIEYGLMRLISETYDLMKRGLGLTDDELAEVYDRWNREELSSYLVEITAQIFRHLDEQTGKRLIDVILDEARQKGTGMWASQDAMDLQVPLPTIDAAVAMRNLSAYKSEREAASKAFARAGLQIFWQSRRFSEAAARCLVCSDDSHLRSGHGPIAESLPRLRLRFGTGKRRTHLARRLHHSRQVAGVDPRSLSSETGLAELAAGSRPRAGRHDAAGKPSRRRARGGGVGHRGAGADGVARLLRRLSQRVDASQSHPGTARLFRSAHL